MSTRRTAHLPLRRWTAVVGQVGGGAGGVGLIFIQVGGQNVAGTVELGAGGFVVAGQDHVRNLVGDTATKPLLPQIPVGLVQHAHITTKRTTLVRDLACWKGVVVCRRVVSGREGSGRAVVADWPVTLAGQDAGVPVVSVTEITTVPGESDTLVDGVAELSEGALGVGVTHVVEDSHGEGSLVTSSKSGLEAQDWRCCGSIGSRNLVVVGGTGCQSCDGDIVEELTALGDCHKRAWRGSVIADEKVSVYFPADKKRLHTCDCIH